MSTTTVPVYFEESWAILSSIGLINVFFGLMIVGITSLSPISFVPIISGAAGAIANGLCYYAFYADYPKTPTVVAAAFADGAWLVQEAGMSFYSYLILTRVLRQRERMIFKILFWAMMVIILMIRLVILVSRARDIINVSTSEQPLIDHLHIGYFSSIAVVECISAFFLLRKFAQAKRTSLAAAKQGGLFSYLMKSTEIRLAILALIGISRAITYSSQTTAQAATNVASQCDRFVYTLECLFPIIMFIDILASKLVVANHLITSSESRSLPYKVSRNQSRNRAQSGINEIPMYSVNKVETRIDAQGTMSSSQERIVEEGRGVSSEEERDKIPKGAISKTVEFEFRESSA